MIKNSLISNLTKQKKKLSIIIFLAVLIFSWLNWQYPYSMISVRKSVSYNPDNKIVESFKKDLQAINDSYSKLYKMYPKDITIDRIQYLLQLYQLPMLNSKQSINIGKNELDFMLSEIREARDLLMSLAFSETYEDRAKHFLIIQIRSCDLLEQTVLKIKHSTSHSRNNLKTELGNLHMDFIQSFMAFETFYEEYEKELKSGKES